MADVPAFNTPKALRNRDTQRRRNYERRLTFYRGQQWDTAATAWNRQRGKRQLVVNYTQALINKATSYVLQDLQYVADPADDSDAAAARARDAEAAFRAVADANTLQLQDFDNELDCSILGDAAWKVTFDRTVGQVIISAPDVTALDAWYDQAAPDRLQRVAQRFTLPAADAVAAYGVAVRGDTARLIEDWTIGEFVLWHDDLPVLRQPNSYGFIPYAIYPNIREPKAQWGNSDLDAFEDVARELNRQVSQLSLICELSGQPITVLENVGESTDIAVQPGAVWELPQDAKAYVLDLLANGGVSLMLQYAELTRALLHDLAETPRTAFGDSEAQLSGVALKVSLDPLAKKVARKRLIRTRALTQRNDMVMRLLNLYGNLPDDIAAHTIRPQWGDVSPNDRTRDVADGIALVNAGVESRRRLAAELGVDDPEQELERWLEESRRIAEVQPTQAPTPQKTAILP